MAEKPPDGVRIFTPDEAKALIRASLEEFAGRKVTPELEAEIRRKLAAVMQEHDGMWVEYPPDYGA